MPRSIAVDKDRRLLLPYIRKAILANQEFWYEQQRAREEKRQRVILDAEGNSVIVPRYISPSTASMCLRWMGYDRLREVLGVQGIAPTVEASLIMMMGNSNHHALFRILQDWLSGHQEIPFTIDLAEMSGRVDIIVRHPLTQRLHLLEAKFVGNYPFEKITGIYAPSPEHRKQVLMYLWALTKMNYEIPCASVLYISRDTAKQKECLISWDEVAQSEADYLIEANLKAHQLIQQKMLPEPTVESLYICKSFCPWRLVCDYGQSYAAKQKKARPALPFWVKKKIEKRISKDQVISIEHQVTQLGLEFTDISKSESLGCRCGDCSSPMAWSKKNKRYICPVCGNK